jgi:hypothetical protein
LQRGLRFGDDAVVPLLLAHGDEREIVVEFVCEAIEGVERGLELSLAFA